MSSGFAWERDLELSVHGSDRQTSTTWIEPSRGLKCYTLGRFAIWRSRRVGLDDLYSNGRPKNNLVRRGSALDRNS